MATVPDFLATFQAQHQEQTAELEQYWARVRDEAASLD